MNKKNLFVLISLVMTMGLIILTSLNQEVKISLSIFLAVLAGALTLLGLRENIAGIEVLTLTTLPGLFTFGMSAVLYYFPNFSLFFKFGFWLIYSFFFYIILLSANIFNVAAEKPIPLVRAAYTASFLVTLFTVFPLYTAIFKSNPPFAVVLLLVGIMTFSLSFQSMWSVFLPKSFDIQTVWASAFVTLVMIEFAAVLSFFPMESFFKALGLSTIYYIVLGLAHHYFKKSLNNKVYLEYLLIASLISFIIFLF